MSILLTLIGMLVFFGGLAYAVYTIFGKSGSGEVILDSKNIFKAVAIVLAVSFLWYICSSAEIIEAGDRGVLFSVFTGVRTDKVLGEGFHIVPKIVNTVTYYDVYTKTYTEKIDCLSKDGLPIDMDISIRYRLNSAQVANIKQNVGSQQDVIEKILVPTTRSKMRDIAATFTAQEAYASKRKELQSEYKTILGKFFEKENYIIAEEILIRKITPPADLIAKIQETKVEEQNVIKQENILAAEKQKKQQAITQAQAEAESLRIRANAVSRNPAIIQLEWIEAWKAGGSQVPKIIMGGKGGAGLLFNMGDVKDIINEKVAVKLQD